MAMAKKLPTGSDEVGVKELRADLSAWLQRVREGAVVIVTDRGTPVARLSPYGAPSGLERLIAEGRVRLPTTPKQPADAKGIPVEGNASELVSEQRG
jgi:prevent-host-death family protein